MSDMKTVKVDGVDICLCAAHGLACCHRCYVDYSLTNTMGLQKRALEKIVESSKSKQVRKDLFPVGTVLTPKGNYREGLQVVVVGHLLNWTSKLIDIFSAESPSGSFEDFVDEECYVLKFNDGDSELYPVDYTHEEYFSEDQNQDSVEETRLDSAGDGHDEYYYDGFDEYYYDGFDEYFYDGYDEYFDEDQNPYSDEETRLDCEGDGFDEYYYDGFDEYFDEDQNPYSDEETRLDCEGDGTIVMVHDGVPISLCKHLLPYCPKCGVDYRDINIIDLRRRALEKLVEEWQTKPIPSRPRLFPIGTALRCVNGRGGEITVAGYLFEWTSKLREFFLAGVFWESRYEAFVGMECYILKENNELEIYPIENAHSDYVRTQTKKKNDNNKSQTRENEGRRIHMTGFAVDVNSLSESFKSTTIESKQQQALKRIAEASTGLFHIGTILRRKQDPDLTATTVKGHFFHWTPELKEIFSQNEHIGKACYVLELDNELKVYPIEDTHREYYRKNKKKYRKKISK